MVKTNKVLEYRRAVFLNDDQNLEDLVRHAWNMFPTQADRAITFSDSKSTCGLSSRDMNASGFSIHCAKYVDGQPVGTIPTTPAAEVEVGERPPEPGENFLNSDMMALVQGNHVISVNCGRNAGSLRIYLQQLFRKAGFPDAARQFELVRIGSPDKLAMIQKFSVQSVDLEINIAEATAFELAADNNGVGHWATITRGLSQVFKGITAKDEALGQLRQAEKGSVKLSINVPKGDLDVARDGLDEFAQDVVDDESSDSFVIHLRDGGGAIKANEVAVRKTVKIDNSANSVSVSQTWDEMKKYIDDLQGNGQLEA